MRRLRYFVRGRLFPCALLALLVLALGILLAIRLPRLLAPVALMERALSFIAALVVLAIPDLPERKIAKLVLLLVLPWVGVILVLSFTEAIPHAPKRQISPHSTGLFSRVSSLAERFRGTHVANADIRYFSAGAEMRDALVADLKKATRRIWLEYYIIAQGKFWGEILELLTEKAKAGIDVRVIFDDFGCSVTLLRGYPRELKRRGIQTGVFRRLRFGRGFSRRDHRKLFLIDDICYTGGMNLADEYVGELIRFGHWKDSAVRLAGDVTVFERLYLQTWYAVNPSRRPKQTLPCTHRERADGTAYVVLSDPAEPCERLFSHLLPMLVSSAETSISLFTPYLSLPHGMLRALESAALAGVDVRLMIPHIPDKKAIFFLTRTYARELIRAGVQVREYTAGFLHAKNIAIDGKYALVSSYNLDFRSLYIQAECGVFAKDTALAEALERDFSACWEHGTELKRANTFAKLLGRICMLFAPLT